MKYYVGIRKYKKRLTLCNIFFIGLLNSRISVFHLIVQRRRIGLHKMRPVSREIILGFINEILKIEYPNKFKVSEHNSFAEAERYILGLESYCSEKPYDIIEDEKEMIEVQH